MKAYCIFYGTKYSYNLVVDLQKEFNKCGVSLKCDYIKDFSVIKEHWHKLKYFNNADEDTIIIDIDQIVVGDISEMINYPVKENELVTYKNWSDGCPIWDKFNSNIDKWQNYYYNNSIVHYQYYGEQNFVHDTVVENGGKIITMPEKWYAKKNIHEDTKIIHHAGVDK